MNEIFLTASIQLNIFYEKLNIKEKKDEDNKIVSKYMFNELTN
jgi:hypothetical protein